MFASTDVLIISASKVMDRRSALLTFAGMFASIVPLDAGQADALNAALEPKLTVEEVVRRTRAGISEDLIVAAIKKNGKAFDLNTEEILDLKKYGVTDAVISYMLDPSHPYTPPPAASAKTGKKYPPDPVASQIPPEPNLYLPDVRGAPISTIDVKVLLGAEESKGFMRKKGKSVAYLLGLQARTRTKNILSPFYLRIPQGKQIEELLLVSLLPDNGRRELNVGPVGPKQQYNPSDMHPFDAVEVGPQLYRMTTSKLTPGEYLFLFIGSADTTKGVWGKGYDFGVDPAKPASAK